MGFQYQYNPKTDQYAHATAIMVLTPEGRVSQYYYGVEYPPKDLRLGLIQASNHKIGNLVDAVLLYCYHYDPATGRYGAIISRVLKLSGLATILVLGGMVLVLFRLGSHHGKERTKGPSLCLKIFHFGPSRASAGAANVDALYIFLVALSVFMCVLIFTTIIVFAVKYRRRPGVPAEQIEGSTALELTWSIIPFFIFLFIFAWGAIIYFQERTPPRDSTEVYVVAKQWMWKLQHQEGPREINELHVPVGRDIKLIMTSQDVIHSFFVPAFRIKQDVLPGRYTTVWFRATKAGTYHLFCAEYCGTSHSGMIGRYRGHGAGAVRGLAEREARAAPMAETGQKLFTQMGCITCHRSERRAAAPIWWGCMASRWRSRTDAPWWRTRITFASAF